MKKKANRSKRFIALLLSAAMIMQQSGYVGFASELDDSEAAVQVESSYEEPEVVLDAEPVNEEPAAQVQESAGKAADASSFEAEDEGEPEVILSDGTDESADEADDGFTEEETIVTDEDEALDTDLEEIDEADETEGLGDETEELSDGDDAEAEEEEDKTLESNVFDLGVSSVAITDDPANDGAFAVTYDGVDYTGVPAGTIVLTGSSMENSADIDTDADVKVVLDNLSLNTDATALYLYGKGEATIVLKGRNEIFAEKTAMDFGGDKAVTIKEDSEGGSLRVYSDNGSAITAGKLSLDAPIAAKGAEGSADIAGSEIQVLGENVNAVLAGAGLYKTYIGGLSDNDVYAASITVNGEAYAYGDGHFTVIDGALCFHVPAGQVEVTIGSQVYAADVTADNTQLVLKEAGETEEAEEEPEVPTKRRYVSEQNDGVVVTAILEDGSAIPDDAELVVTKVTPETSGYNYDAYMEALDASDAEKSYNSDNTLLYDIAFIGEVTDEEGKVTTKEFQPTEGSVRVNISFKENQLSEELGAEKNADVEVNHLPLADAVREEADTTKDATDISAGDVVVQPMDAAVSVNAEKIALTTEDLSVFSFTVDFHYKGTDYSIPGKSQILLSELIEIMHITVPDGDDDPDNDVLVDVKNVKSVTFSDAHLVDVQEVSGIITYNDVEGVDVGEKDFLLTSLEPFTSDEVLTIELEDGTIIEVGVTDYNSEGIEGLTTIDANGGFHNSTLIIFEDEEGNTVSGAFEGDYYAMLYITGALDADLSSTINPLSAVLPLDDVVLEKGIEVKKESTGNHVYLNPYASSVGDFTLIDGNSSEQHFRNAKLRFAIIKGNANSITNDVKSWAMGWYTGGITLYNEGDELSNNYIIKSITADNSAHTIKVVLKEKNHQIVTVNTFDYNGTTLYTQENVSDWASISGDWMLRVTAKDSEKKSYLALKPIDISQGGTNSILINGFIAVPENPGENDSPSRPTPDTVSMGDDFTVTDVRLIKNENYTWGQIFDNGLVDDHVPGFQFLDGSTEGNNSILNLKRSYAKEYYVRLLFTPEAGEFTADENVYLYGVVEHKSGSDSYFFKKILLSDYEIQYDDNGKPYIDILIPQWQNENGQPILDKFTGSEVSITATLVKGKSDTNLNNVIGGTNSSVVTDGSILGTYTVHYGERNEETDDSAFIDKTIDIIELTKNTASKDYTISSILGQGINYGITADRLQQGGSDFQSNFAVNNYQDNSNGVNPNLSGANAGGIAIGNYVQYSNGGPDNAETVYEIGNGTEYEVIPLEDVYLDEGKTQTRQDDIGTIEIGSTYENAQIILFTDSADRQKEKREFVHTVVMSADEVANNIVEPIIQHMEAVSSSMLTHPASITPLKTSDKVTIDVSAYPDDVTLYIDGDALLAEYPNTQLDIRKKENQVIVFNYATANDVKISQFVYTVVDDSGNVIRNGNSSTSTANALGGDTLNSSSDYLAQHIIFNLAVADTITIDNVSATFLIPNENSKTFVDTTSAGWLVSDGFVYNKGEWHNVYADLEDVDKTTIYAYKEIDGNDATSDQIFIFEIGHYLESGQLSNVYTVENDGSLITYTTADNELYVGWNVYQIHELRQKETTVGEYDIDEQFFYAVVKYENSNGHLIAGSPSYYKHFNVNEFDHNASTITGVSDPVAAANVIFNNHLETGNLKLKKIVEDSEAPNSVFTFEITCTQPAPTTEDPNAVQAVSGLFNTKLVDKNNTETEGTIRFSNGLAVVTLTAGETLEIIDLPSGTSYSIKETKVGNKNFYEGKVTDHWKKGTKTGDSGEIVTDETVEAKFVNEYVSNNAKIKLSAKKKANTALGDKTFEFQLFEGDNEAAKETSDPVKQGETAAFSTITVKSEDLTLTDETTEKKYRIFTALQG
ncbi:MAG: hypothetical protein IJX67_07295 [Oscillospiraceae bacterium]|nr:hypothetical protein [Oscillospiraceae bacterium]